MSRLVLGINSAHGDSAAALVGEQGLIAAIAEERINRRKHCAGFPTLAVKEVLRIAGAQPSDITDVAVARDPSANLAAKLAYIAKHPNVGAARALSRFRIHHKVSSGDELAEALGSGKSLRKARFHQVEHHLAHIASAYYGSPFERATGISVDASGDFASAMIATCEGHEIKIHHRTLFPHSLGVLYTAICQYIGFDHFGEEYKVMGLSAYGVNRFAPELKQLVRFHPERGIELDLAYFRHHQIASGLEMSPGGELHVPKLWGERLLPLFGPPRRRKDPLTDRDRDLAASLQIRFEEVYIEHVNRGVAQTGIRDAAMAGGSALNSVGNGRLITERVVDRAYFHPAASDDGTAVGAAFAVLYGKHKVPRTTELRHAYWGPARSEREIEQALVASRLPFQRLGREDLVGKAAGALAQGKIVGWFQGREEWGPRALGNRSILCHPGWPSMKATLNARIKNREPFRPFAPSVRLEKLSTCFHGSHEVPFMIIVYRVRPEWKERLSAITHEDGTGRVQTVRREDNPLYYDLLSEFERRTQIPVLLNTSFNENEPIVHTPAEAIDCFARTRMDTLGIGPFWLEKPSENG
jgi:carbamoyltransferase